MLVEKAIATMEELIRTNNVVTLSFVGTLLKEAGIQHFVADENMSVMDGSINALSRRLMVDSERIEEAAAGLWKEPVSAPNCGIAIDERPGPA